MLGLQLGDSSLDLRLVPADYADVEALLSELIAERKAKSFSSSRHNGVSLAILATILCK